jgi:hexosaminidase
MAGEVTMKRVWVGLAGVAAALVVGSATVSAAGTPAVSGSAPAPAIVPKPVSLTPGSGRFRLSPATRIVMAGESPGAAVVAQDLAGYLRPATGYSLPVTGGEARRGDIVLSLGDAPGPALDPTGEGYQLAVSAQGVRLEARTAHGLFDGVQTIRQLLPPWIVSPRLMPGPWTMPAVRITDYPRYRYRGFMLDIARHFEPPAVVMQLIDEVSAYKINVLHLHLSDDQGFRMVINGFPRLTSIGGQGSVGTEGRSMDPGGYWTQAEYRAVVQYAAARFITVVPEVDSPGHTNAIIMSEFGDVANPLLNGHPQDIDCSASDPPAWNYTTAVGYSALCPTSANTWTILTAIIDQLSGLSPGPYYDIGGDEVAEPLLNRKQYAGFVNREAGVVNAAGKQLMGWADIAGPGTTPPPGTVAEYWQPADGSSPAAETAREAVAKGMQIVMAPAFHAYLDQKYIAGRNPTVPVRLGLDWACPTGCDVDRAYNWDPGKLVSGVGDRNVIGVEGAMWGETVINLGDVQYMVFPRLPALAEVGWSAETLRTLGSPAYRDFLQRLAAQGARLQAGGQNFYPSTEVPWRLDAVAWGRAAGHGDHVDGTLATVSAPGIPTEGVAATFAWGDGTSSPGTVSGPNPRTNRVNGLYLVSGSHTYAAPGEHEATLTLRAPGMAPLTIAVAIRTGS